MRSPSTLTRLALLGLALAPAATALPPAPRTPQADGDDVPERRSLEDLLREAEVERARRAASLLPEVQGIVSEMDALRSRVAGPSSRALQRRLTDLGPGALPLLVPFLEPGKDASRGEVFRGELVAEVLREATPPTVTDAVLELAKVGSPAGRLNALTVLAATPEPARVIENVILIASGKGIVGLPADQAETVRDAGFRALASIATPRAMEFMRTSLLSGDAAVAAAALRALEAAPTATSAPHVLGLLESGAAPGVAQSIVTYYTAHELLLADDAHAKALGSVAAAQETSSTQRVALLDLLRVNDADIGVQVKRRIEEFQDDARMDVRTAVLLLLARQRDRGARRVLMDPLDDEVRNGRNPIESLSTRAQMHYEIGDWSGAVKDWRAVMKEMSEERVNRRRKEPYIGLARALARQKKYRDAADYLSSAPISLDELRGLAKQRDFREMLESRYRDTFHLKED